MVMAAAHPRRCDGACTCKIYWYTHTWTTYRIFFYLLHQLWLTFLIILGNNGGSTSMATHEWRQPLLVGNVRVMALTSFSSWLLSSTPQLHSSTLCTLLLGLLPALPQTPLRSTTAGFWTSLDAASSIGDFCRSLSSPTFEGLVSHS